MDEGKLDLVFWQIGAEFGWEILQIAQEDGFVLGAWVEERRCVLVVAVELIIGG